MRFYTHIALAVLLYTLFVWIFDQTFSIAGILFTAWISIMPDLIERAIGEHRSWGHSIIWLIPIIASFFFNITLGIAFISGFMSHILLDIITKKGVAFFYPFNKTRFIMPAKEKSRIQTGSKQEKALCLVIILILIPVAYGVVHGMPDYGVIAGNNSTLNKITGNNSTLGDLIKKITGNLKNNGSNGYQKYKSNNYVPYNTTKTKAAANTVIKDNSTADDTKSLIDWLTDNSQSDDTPINNNNNNNTNTNANATNQTNSTENNLISLLDPLFGDLSNSTNTEQNITMEDDSADFIPSGYDPGNNPDADNWDDSGSDDSENSGGFFDFFLTLTSLFKVI